MIRSQFQSLATRGESTIGRVPSAAGADARRRDAGDAGTSLRSANEAYVLAALEPEGRIGFAGNLCVARRRRCPCIASSSRLDLARKSYARGLLYFHHGLLRLRMRMGGKPELPGQYHRPIRRSMSCMLVCLSFLLFGAASPVGAEEIDRLIAAVNRNIITEGDLQLANTFNAIISNDSKPFTRSRSESIRRLINLELMRQELDNFSLSPEDESRIEERIKSLHQANSANGSLENLLSQFGLHESELRSYLRLESSILKFVDFRFRPFASVSDEEIRRYYEEKLTLQLQKAKLEIPPLMEVSTKIEVILQEDKINTALEKWIEDIRHNSHIEYFEEESRLLGSD